MESIYPFLLIVAPFALAFLLEAVILYFFKPAPFWTCLRFSLLANLLSVLILYVSSQLLSQLNYHFGGLQFPLPVIAFFWWLSVLIDVVLLPIFFRSKDRKQLFVAAVAMNTVSFLFLSFFISNSH